MSKAKTTSKDSDYFKDKMLLMQAQENGANDLALNVDHVFEAGECDAFDSDVDEGPITQTMFMTNLTSEDQIYDEAGPSYDPNTPFEELVGEYEKRAKFELTDRERKIDEQMRKIIEDKFLEEFLDIKRLKDKIEDRLYKQDQSVQTVHMLCQPKSFYDEKNKVAIGYKNPLCLTRAKQAQSALYNGHVLVTTNHTLIR
ncbi:hypothetical protein Tco_0166013, partial [Tanacetum coccineum]